MGITARQAEILNRLVQEYIELAEPVSSQLLERKYDFGICPATIRIEMQKLTDKGFLYQPHTSAGRIPTDRGYRFFVDGLLEKELSSFEGDFEVKDWFEKEFAEALLHLPERSERREMNEVQRTTPRLVSLGSAIGDIIRFIQLLTKNLALSSSALVLSYLEKERIFWKEGWEEVLKEPEFREEDYIINFAKLLENFEKNIKDLKLNSGIKIYIGRENPFKKAKDFSIILTKCCLPGDGETIISLLGPKRMAYDRNIKLMNSLVNLLEKF